MFITFAYYAESGDLLLYKLKDLSPILAVHSCVKIMWCHILYCRLCLLFPKVCSIYAYYSSKILYTFKCLLFSVMLA